MDDAQSNRSLVQKGRADGGMDHIPVTFWMPDGSSHEGMTPCIGGQVIFIESKQAVQLGTEISIKLTTKEDEADSKWGVTEGIVVWHCPLEDDFKNRAGFGVSLRGGWPKPSCPTETGGSKEPA